ncbi:hypothetical protein [Virgibacillus sp. L01]|uniref:hypothetical protein n=1 Tax=Virgibacillus sp. L01 TaxID=3457429 RepID=UPI003FD16E0A
MEREVNYTVLPKRIVSFAPAITETMYRLDLDGDCWKNGSSVSIQKTDSTEPSR